MTRGQPGEREQWYDEESADPSRLSQARHVVSLQGFSSFVNRLRTIAARAASVAQSGVSLDRAQELIEALSLAPHPERGFFVETYRAALQVDSAVHGRRRAASTAIYFLLTRAQPATYLHRLRSDEVFHYYEGGALEVLLLGAADGGRVARLGTDLARGERPQILIPAGTWFAAELVPSASHCLFGCTVAPGFDFADFELAAGPELATGYPDHAAAIARLSRPGLE